MFSIPASAPAARLASILDLLCRAVVDHGGRKVLAGSLVILIWIRLRRISTRVLRLAARIEAGPARPARPRRQRARHPQRPRPQRPPPPLRLPRGKGWLVRLMRMDAAAAGSQLRHLLNQPDMQALAAADPRMGRLLRPLCHMLGVTPTLEIAKPAATARPTPPAAETAPPRPATTPAAAPSAPSAAIIPLSSCKRRRGSRGMRPPRPSHGPQRPRAEPAST